ncbi:Mth938-like domain-containing protein [uncultured Thiodictyon sp.]|uniref:Mth938-like domain-containing protein n=1 Tax=uncultured Thiodictyon sp. TaxID=1846217 RepID=UPI0025ECB6E8|nr:Mth938-like domain-containing protein [uncultured Thiodictyon sp.]
MRFAETDDSGGNLIQAYGPEGIRIGGRTYRGGLIITPGRIITDWGPVDAAALNGAHLQALVDLNPELIVLGTGPTQVFGNPSLYRALMQRRIGVEWMDTGAACRTYNILMAEGRRVVAGLLPL